MKCEVVIDPHELPRAVIYTNERNGRIDEIVEFIERENEPLLATDGTSTLRLEPASVSAFISEGGAVYAIVSGKRLVVRERLYMLEEMLGRAYVRISQSCLANIAQIAKFEATVGGSLAVIFKDGFRDYISRRQLKTVKERIGIKKK